jgi:ABC-2 type transport system ATP-binding protein
VALLGDNGAGKTTALRILLGLIEASEGHAEVLGLESRTQGEEIRRRVGYVPERPTLYPWMTVAEIGWFAAGFYPSGYLQKYRELVRGFQLPLDRKLKALSKGMLAKVSLALAMAHEPELLVLDEPTSGLDPLVRREFLESMVEVAAAGRTVLLSSHQLGEVERVADMVAVLKQGRLVLCERLDDLKSRVRELTITFVNGSSQLPPLGGTLIRSDGEERQRRLLVRDFDEARLEALRGDAQVRQVEIRHPSLEEIFVGYLQSSEHGVPS